MPHSELSIIYKTVHGRVEDVCVCAVLEIRFFFVNTNAVFCSYAHFDMALTFFYK